MSALLFLMIGLSANASQVINGFRYASCSSTECVTVTAPRAFVSALQGGFTTEGDTVLELSRVDGSAAARSFKGSTATFNPKLNALTLDLNGGGFVIHSLRRGETQTFAGVTP